MGEFFGWPVKETMSACLVGNVTYKGNVAADIQLAYEMAQSEGESTYIISFPSTQFKEPQFLPLALMLHHIGRKTLIHEQWSYKSGTHRQEKLNISSEHWELIPL